MKIKTFAVVVAAAFAASSVFAGEKAGKACCAQEAKMDCANYANLNLSPEQKTKMDALAADCHKGGCNEATMAKMTKGAKKVLNKEQFATWKAGVHSMTPEKTRS